MPSPSASRVSEPDLGPFFRVDAMTPGADWRPLGADLASRGALGAWIDRARERTAAAGSLHSDDVDVRALCAVLHLGVCARVLSPWIASALRGTSPGRSTGADVPTLDQLFWQDDGTTTFPLALSPEWSARPALATPVAHAASDASVAVNTSVDHFARALVDRLAIPLTSTALTPSASIAWGNVASALHGAAHRRQGRSRPVDGGETDRRCLPHGTDRSPWPTTDRRPHRDSELSPSQLLSALSAAGQLTRHGLRRLRPAGTNRRPAWLTMT